MRLCVAGEGPEMVKEVAEREEGGEGLKRKRWPESGLIQFQELKM